MQKKYFLYKSLSFLARPFIIRKYNLVGDPIVIPKEKSLIVSNHVTNVDFLIINAMSKGTFMHFVLAQNIVRNPFLKHLIQIINDPIVHFKGSNSINTVKSISKCIKKGDNVMIFPEGNTSFDGCTDCLDDNIGKLAKLCSGNLVMIRIKGGYLSRPRWGTTLRKGEISLESVCVSADEIKKMSVSEVTDMINKNIYTDAYKEQSEKPIEFSGKRSCLGIERAMYKCPRCNSIGTLHSENDIVQCDCGYMGKYNKLGYVTDELNETHSVKEYLQVQKEWIAKLSCNQDEILFSDTVNVTDISNNTKYDQIKIDTYSNYVVCKYLNEEKNDIVIKCEDIKNVTIFKANTMTVFVDEKDGESHKEKVFEITGDFSFNALKYRDLFEILCKG